MSRFTWNDGDHCRAIEEYMKSDEYRREEALISYLRDKEETARQSLAKAWEQRRYKSQVINEEVDLVWCEKARVRAEYAKEVRIYNILQNFGCQNRMSRPTLSPPIEPRFMRDERIASDEFQAIQHRGKSDRSNPPYK